MLNAHWPQRILALPWRIIALVLAISIFAVVILYSAAGGSMHPWALNHAIRLAAFLGLALMLSQFPLRFWLAAAYPLYALTIMALIGVDVMGAVSGGSRRWLDLGFFNFQPSEFMKIVIILALARFYHYLPPGYAGRFAGLWPPMLLIFLPTTLVMLQPDLGTGLMIVAGGVTMMFLGGLPLRWILVPGGLGLASLPILFSMLHDYQKKRVLIFLNPETDPLGAGYHITQSKIAIGSGGMFGKGFGQGSQSHLLYLPEQHTDFVFATMAEEWGLMGGVLLLLGFGILLNWGIRIGLAAETAFARLVAVGLSMTVFFYVAINCMMVMGLAPVVGIPFPLLSYGGSAIMTVMIAFGLLMGIHSQREDADI